MLKYYKNTEGIVAGIDEAGRGCLSGPVVAAAVMLPENHPIPELNDSKQLSDSTRRTIFTKLHDLNIPIGVGVVSPQTIDKINILQATYLAMHKAITHLSALPVELLVDGNRFKPYLGITHTCVIKGDAVYSSIAAASVIAKVTRDNLMIKLHELYPQYDWLHNKGYPTKKHKEALHTHGLTPIHRKSFSWQQ